MSNAPRTGVAHDSPHPRVSCTIDVRGSSMTMAHQLRKVLRDRPPRPEDPTTSHSCANLISSSKSNLRNTRTRLVYLLLMSGSTFAPQLRSIRPAGPRGRPLLREYLSLVCPPIIYQNLDVACTEFAVLSKVSCRQCLVVHLLFVMIA